MKISDILAPEDVVIDAPARSKEEVLRFMAERAGRRLAIDPSYIMSALCRREALGSTGMGGGIAMPHATLGVLEAPFGILACMASGIDFDAVDEAPVDIVCLVLAPPTEAARNLTLMAKLARQLRAPAVAQSIRRRDGQRSVYFALIGCDDAPPP
jgi:nitrogen PTS system EIIA component